jgi:CRP-like cAMP-binding protein
VRRRSHHRRRLSIFYRSETACWWYQRAHDATEGDATMLHTRDDHERRAKVRAAVEQLRSLPEFAHCSDADFADLARTGTATAMPSQWAFLHESTPADAAYLVVNGTAKVFKHGIAIATVAVGDVVGEAGLLNETLRNATVSSVSALKALRIDKVNWAALMARRPELRQAFQQIAAARMAVAPA